MGNAKSKSKTKLPVWFQSQIKKAEQNQDPGEQYDIATFYLVLASEPSQNQGSFQQEAYNWLLKSSHQAYLLAYVKLAELAFSREDYLASHEWYTKLKEHPNSMSKPPKYRNYYGKDGVFSYVSPNHSFNELAKVGLAKTTLIRENQRPTEDEINVLFNYLSDSVNMFSDFSTSSYLKQDGGATKLQLLLENLAEKGVTEAQVIIGRMYYFGKDLLNKECPKDIPKGLGYLNLAADQGNIDAALLIGDLHAEGKASYIKDEKNAFKYFLKAAENAKQLAQPPAGGCIAQIIVGEWYLKGIVIEKNASLAVEWLELSVKTSETWPGMTLSRGILGKVVSNSQAWLSLAQLHRDGEEGVPKNPAQAIFYFQKLVKSHEYSANNYQEDPDLYKGSAEDKRKYDSYNNEIERIRMQTYSALMTPVQAVLPSSPTLPVFQTSSFVINYDSLKIKQPALGEGAFGTVYYAECGHEKYAVKQLKIQNFTTEALDAFTSEVNIMKKLRSNYIIELRGICIKPYCLVMNFAEGGSLDSLLHSNQEIMWPKRIKIATQIGKGLAYLHSQNPKILHRDLKSMNVLLTEHHDAKLSDFGLAKLKTDSTFKASVGAAGTAAWMAPELFGDNPTHTEETDIYSLAIILWELATRKIPFAGINIVQIAFKIIQNIRPDFPTDSCSPEYYRIITLAWAQQSNERTKLNVIIEDLEKITSNQSGYLSLSS